MGIKETLLMHGLTSVLGQRVYLTGSRFFGTNLSSSDYDFFTKANDDVPKRLVSLGFKRIECGKYAYSDQNTLAVFRCENLDVQLTLNIDLKLRVQEFMRANNLGRTLALLSKMQRKNIWDAIQILMRTSKKS